MMTSDILKNWKRLRVGDLTMLKAIAASADGQAAILGQVAKIVDTRTANSASGLEETFILGVQIRSVWPSGAETNITLRRISDHTIAFMCGFVGRTFENAYDMIVKREELVHDNEVLEIEGLDKPSDHIVASVANAA